MRKVIANLKALVEVMEALSKDAPEEVGKLITDEVLPFHFISFANMYAGNFSFCNIVKVRAICFTLLVFVLTVYDFLSSIHPVFGH